MFKLLHLLVGFLFLAFVHGATKLEGYNVDEDSLTVSGLSAGGAMAMQFHFAFSSEIYGAGVIAGLPYACGKGGIADAVQCMSIPDYFAPIEQLIENANLQSNQGSIDDVANLQGSKAYIFHGTKDTTVHPGNGLKIKQMYEEFGAEVVDEFTFAATHGFPTDFYGAACSQSSAATQYINDCDYNGAFEMFNTLYGGELVTPDTSVEPKGEFIEFDQSEFFSGEASASSMDSIGFAYIPSGCQDRTNKCRGHLAFHGCLQSRTNTGVGDIFATKAGYLHAAEVNNIIVIFPQAVAMGNTNPNACFDWWGYLNPNYATQSGAQMIAIRKMLQRITDCPTCSNVTTAPPVQTTVRTTTNSGTGQPIPTTTRLPSVCGDGDGEIFRPFEGSCEYYTTCGCGGVDILLKCAPGLYFDPTIGNCNFQHLVDCQITKYR